MVGIVVKQRLRALARQRRLFWMRGFFIALVVGIAYASCGYELAMPVGSDTARVGQHLALALMGAQILLLAVFVPPYAASAIAVEKQPARLDVMRVAGVRAWQVVVGHLLALLVVFGQLVLGCVPLYVLVQWLGGVDLRGVALLAGIAGAALVWFTALGLCASVCARQVHTAVLGTYIAIIASVYGVGVLLSKVRTDSFAEFAARWESWVIVVAGPVVCGLVCLGVGLFLAHRVMDHGRTRDRLRPWVCRSIWLGVYLAVLATLMIIGADFVLTTVLAAVALFATFGCVAVEAGARFSQEREAGRLVPLLVTPRRGAQHVARAALASVRAIWFPVTLVMAHCAAVQYLTDLPKTYVWMVLYGTVAFVAWLVAVGLLFSCRPDASTRPTVVAWATILGMGVLWPLGPLLGWAVGDTSWVGTAWAVAIALVLAVTGALMFTARWQSRWGVLLLGAALVLGLSWALLGSVSSRANDPSALVRRLSIILWLFEMATHDWPFSTFGSWNSAEEFLLCAATAYLAGAAIIFTVLALNFDRMIGRPSKPNGWIERFRARGAGLARRAGAAEPRAGSPAPATNLS